MTPVAVFLLGYQVYLILSYLILSYLILSYLILSYLILSYLILSYLSVTPVAVFLLGYQWIVLQGTIDNKLSLFGGLLAVRTPTIKTLCGRSCSCLQC
eukprot:SAG31_NODE_1253_length_9089_cov_17.716765_5_plen_98_part_00